MPVSHILVKHHTQKVYVNWWCMLNLSIRQQ